MQHAKHIGTSKNTPYSYFHRIRMDVNRPYMDRPIVNQLLGQSESRAVQPFYANRARQLGTEFIYPEWSGSVIDVPHSEFSAGSTTSSFSNPLQQQQVGEELNITLPQDRTPSATTSHNLSFGSMVTNELVDSSFEMERFSHDTENTSIEGASTPPPTPYDRTTRLSVTDSTVHSSLSSLDSSLNREIALIDSQSQAVTTVVQPETTLIDWLERVQARVPINLEEDLNSSPAVRDEQKVDTLPSVSTEKASDPVDHNYQHFPAQDLALTDKRNASSEQLTPKQGSVDIELPGPQQPRKSKEIQARNPEPSLTHDTSWDNDTTGKQTEPSKLVSRKLVVRKREPTESAYSKKSPMTISTPKEDPSSPKRESTKITGKPVARNNHLRAAKLNRIQQALEVQSRLIRGQADASDERGQSVDHKVSAAQASNHKPAVTQPPQTGIVQRTVSVLASDYAFLERSYSCRLGPRGYK